MFMLSYFTLMAKAEPTLDPDTNAHFRRKFKAAFASQLFTDFYCI